VQQQQRYLRTELDETSAKDLFDRILDGCIVIDPSARLTLPLSDLNSDDTRIVVEPERREKPFIVPL
jgi:hypothetical protein